jgi:ABC-type arginine transport system ATPase subunit
MHGLTIKQQDMAVAAVGDIDGCDAYRMCHQTFQFFRPCDTPLFPNVSTALMSGIAKAGPAPEDLTEPDRGLIFVRDRVGTIAQARRQSHGNDIGIMEKLRVTAAAGIGARGIRGQRGDDLRRGPGALFPQSLRSGMAMVGIDTQFLGREIKRNGFVDDAKMEAETRKIMGRLSPSFCKFSVPVCAFSGGQRQSVAIARAVYFNARILIMDEPTASLGPHEALMMVELIQKMKAQGMGIFPIEHDIRNEMGLCDRASMRKTGQLVGTGNTNDFTDDDIQSMIILGKKPAYQAS